MVSSAPGVWILIVAMSILLTLSDSACALADGWGRILYPAQGLIDMREGTVEAWVKFQFDTGEQADPKWQSVGSLFHFTIPESKTDRGASLDITVGVKQAKCLLRVGFLLDGKEVPYPVTPDCTALDTMAWHHVAVVWRRGAHLTVYLNGKQVAERQFPWRIVRDIPSTARLVIGHEGYIGRNMLAVDELRISSIAREPHSLSYHTDTLSADPWTLFLERFENTKTVNGILYSIPDLVAAVGAASMYEIRGGKIVPGKFGYGYSFDGRNDK